MKRWGRKEELQLFFVFTSPFLHSCLASPHCFVNVKINLDLSHLTWSETSAYSERWSLLRGFFCEL